MKHYIVGVFDQDSWLAHGKHWLASVLQHRGDAGVIVFHPVGISCDGVKVVTYDGTFEAVLRDLAVRDGVFLYAAPTVRFQANPSAVFDAAAQKFVVVPRDATLPGPSFAIYEEFWAAPADLIDLLCRAIDLTVGTGCKPALFEAHYAGYFAEFFPWFRNLSDSSTYLTCFEAERVDENYVSPKTKTALTAFGIDKPESRKIGVTGSIVKGSIKPKKHLLTTDSEEGKILRNPSSDE